VVGGRNPEKEVLGLPSRRQIRRLSLLRSSSLRSPDSPTRPFPTIMSIVTIRVRTEIVSLIKHVLNTSDSKQNVEFLNNPARFSDPYHFKVTFECIAPLKDGEN